MKYDKDVDFGHCKLATFRIQICIYYMYDDIICFYLYIIEYTYTHVFEVSGEGYLDILYFG